MTAVWQTFQPKLLYGIARRVAPGRPELWDDMVQEGWLRLLTVDGKPVSNPDSYYRHVVQYAMLDMVRRELVRSRVMTFSRAKRLGLLRCPSCYSQDIAWTVYWPSLVRCRECAEQFAVEQASTDP